MPGHARRALSRLVREPLLHFLVIGTAVFAVHGAAGPAMPTGDEGVIDVTPATVGRLESQFAGVWRRPPTAEERAGLIDDYVREEVYYREALALGLDRDDTVIRRRLRRKMEFLGDAGAGAPGQLLFIALVLVVGALLARLYPLVIGSVTRPGGRGLGMASYLMGGIAAVWFVGRVAAF